MPRHCQFKISDAPLHQKGRMLRMSKAYAGQDFSKQTVLTDDVFTYVTFYYCSHHKPMKFVRAQNVTKYGNANQFGYEFYWNQARIFYDAAKNLPIESAPVAAYYSMLNAAKSYLSYTSASADVFVDQFGLHGLNEDNTDSGEDLSTISIKHKQNGVFPLFASKLNSDFLAKWPITTSISLKSLLYNLPFVHRAFSMTYTTRAKKVDELFLPLNAGDAPQSMLIGFTILNSIEVMLVKKPLKQFEYEWVKARDYHILQRVIQQTQNGVHGNSAILME